MGAYAIDAELSVVSELAIDPEPKAPTAPEPGDCCGDGCARCVNDVYAEALERYESAVAAWRKRQKSSGNEDEHPGLSSGATPAQSSYHDPVPHNGR